jgi:hypothetical protein
VTSCTFNFVTTARLPDGGQASGNFVFGDQHDRILVPQERRRRPCRAEPRGEGDQDELQDSTNEAQNDAGKPRPRASRSAPNGRRHEFFSS